MTDGENADKNIYLLCGGGTGGHLFPALAIGEKLLEMEPSCEIHFVGSAKGLEYRIIPGKGYPLHLLPVRGIRRSFAPANLLVPFVLIWSVIRCLFLLKKIRPSAVIGTGGYASGPMLFTAALAGFPTLVQEQNSYPGVTTRILSRVVDRVHIGFAESAKYFKDVRKVKITGNPVREFDRSLTKSKARSLFRLRKDASTLLVFGGSQGALAINEALLGCLRRLMTETDLQMIWCTGTKSYHRVKSVAEIYGQRIWLSDFCQDMAAAYTASDLALCRAGAIALAELSLFALPSLLVPYPFAAANHQEINARTFEKTGAAEVITEDELVPAILGDRLIALIKDSVRLEDMRDKIRAVAFPDATAAFVESVFQVVGKKRDRKASV